MLIWYARLSCAIVSGRLNCWFRRLVTCGLWQWAMVRRDGTLDIGLDVTHVLTVCSVGGQFSAVAEEVRKFQAEAGVFLGRILDIWESIKPGRKAPKEVWVRFAGKFLIGHAVALGYNQSLENGVKL